MVVVTPRIFQKELNIRLAGYPSALAGGYSASTYIIAVWAYYMSGKKGEKGEEG